MQNLNEIFLVSPVYTQIFSAAPLQGHNFWHDPSYPTYSHALLKNELSLTVGSLTSVDDNGNEDVAKI